MWWNMKNSGFIKICIIFAFILVIASSVFLITSYMYNSKGNEINNAMSSELSQKDSIQSTKETAKINISNESPEQTTYINKENEHSKEEILSKKVEESLAKMTLEEKVAQLFFVTPEALTGIAQVTRAAEQSKNSFNVPKTPTMKKLGEENDVEKVRQVGFEIGRYLNEYGFNLNFAPDADVLTEPKNKVIGDRSFGKDPYLVSDMASAYIQGLNEAGVLGCYKHFPGHGGTLEDSHSDFAYSYKTLEELKKAELVPFLEAIKQEVPVIMVSHISLPNVIGDNTPTSLSKKMLSEFLRGELNYEGIIITDALDMGAINNHYSIKEAVKKSFNAGADMLLITSSFKEAYFSLLEAFKNGEIPEERLDESLRRILRVKLSN